MKIQQVEGDRERRIIIGMIVNREVLGKIASIWDNDPFQSKAANIIGSKCVRYYRKYNEPPGRTIESLIRLWSEKNKDKEATNAMENLLQSLSDEYERAAEINAQHLIDVAAEHFTRIRISRMIEQLEDQISTNDVKAADETVRSYSRVEFRQNSLTHILTDESTFSNVFSEDNSQMLIEYPDAIGSFFGNDLARDSFIAFIAPEKVGKTWMLLDLAYRAVSQRCRTLFFEVGDMSLKQIMTRFVVRISNHPMTACVVKKPIAFKQDPKEIVYKQGLTEAKARECFAKFTQRFKEDYFAIAAYPTSSMNVDGIREIILEKIGQGFTPDVICIDYADILSPPYRARKYDLRDQINATWEQLRSLSLEFHCLVATASQARRDPTRGNKVLTISDTSEDKRKAAHVTAMYGLNQTAEEKEKGHMRLNVMARREGDFSVRRCIKVASCLALGNPCVVSSW